ncbi:MAG: metalloregulator ArsR/SmtB family transcription factor [Chroococcidiopsidaceae cyanobacterium CP_BM_ER_R8_30]|nr:metalloregulator ArsR/SmtB family transcription factor [Chroococcidiopsidaceae cyanobacterium CP_BM_ER_R8_30]
MKNNDVARFADLFAALGSESRLEVMRLLLAAYPRGLTVGEIQSQLNIPSSTLSHHLEKLRHEELVTARRDKQWLWYSANAQTLEDLLAFLYNGCSTHERVKESVPVTATREGFVFENFFRSIFEGLFGSGSTFEQILERIPLQRFTQPAVRAMELAQNEARQSGHDFVGTEHMLLGLISEGSGVAAQVLRSLGVTLEQARTTVEGCIGRGRGSVLRDIPFTPRAKHVLDLSLEQVRQVGQNQIDTEHLLLSILQEGGGVAVRVLANLGVDLPHLEQQLRGATG